MGEFTLQPRGETGGGETRQAAALSEALLARNAIWFCDARWLVVMVLFGLALLAARDVPARLGLHLDYGWLLGTALLLAGANVFFLWHCAQLPRPDLEPVASPEPAAGAWNSASVNLWMQIIVDLVAVTVVVNRFGSVSTFVPFLFVPHIVLSCVFFQPLASLGVLLLASGLYIACSLLEAQGLLPGGFVISVHAGRHVSVLWRTVSVCSALAIWVMTWALVAGLSRSLRRRERELVEAHRTISGILRDSQQHMLYTAHQMKSPLAAVMSITAVLAGGYAGDLPERTRGLLERIDTKAKALMEFVIDVLRLAHIRSRDQSGKSVQPLRLDALLRDCAGALQDLAAAREVRMELELRPATARGNPEELRAMLDNLVSNAVNYSLAGGAVEVGCTPASAGTGPVISVRDHGIGIPGDKIYKIFAEYYRTNEAKQHNPNSTGVGLAIVKEVARKHGVSIRVQSEQGQGTLFELRFPGTQEPPRARADPGQEEQA